MHAGGNGEGRPRAVIHLGTQPVPFSRAFRSVIYCDYILLAPEATKPAAGLGYWIWRPPHQDVESEKSVGLGILALDSPMIARRPEHRSSDKITADGRSTPEICTWEYVLEYKTCVLCPLCALPEGVGFRNDMQKLGGYVCPLHGNVRPRLLNETLGPKSGDVGLSMDHLLSRASRNIVASRGLRNSVHPGGHIFPSDVEGLENTRKFSQAPVALTGPLRAGKRSS